MRWLGGWAGSEAKIRWHGGGIDVEELCGNDGGM